MSDQEERDDGYSKCLKCYKEFPSEGFVGGLCASCFLEKHYCEDCDYILLHDTGDEDDVLSLAQCLKAPDVNNNAPIAKRFDNAKTYRFCSTMRLDCPEQCEKFKYHVGA